MRRTGDIELWRDRGAHRRSDDARSPRVGLGVNSHTDRRAPGRRDRAARRSELVLPLMESLTGDLLPRDGPRRTVRGPDLHCIRRGRRTRDGRVEESEKLAAR